jgi:PIN domain nuclease of toxin-antitoxin system
VRVLLDTHALLWFVLNDERLSRNARSIMTEPSTDLLVSPASFWEIAIKISIGKYSLGKDLAEFMERHMDQNDMILLPITARHAAVVAGLPFHHRDPFDRLLIAQAMTERIPLVSSDRVFDRYDVARVW